MERLQETSLVPDFPLKKSKTILYEILKDGMLKFQFLLDSCTPGSLPDAQLVAAMLDLKAPVLARAAFLLECCHFVHRCNRGQWPGWMKMFTISTASAAARWNGASAVGRGPNGLGSARHVIRRNAAASPRIGGSSSTAVVASSPDPS